MTASFEIKSVDGDSRIIEGYCAVYSNVDRVNDVIDTKAFDRFLQQTKADQVGVFLSHDMSSLPLGIPIEIRSDGRGLFTKTLIKPTAGGDELLGTAKFLQQHNQNLGMSIGYHTNQSHYEQREGKSVRILTDLSLVEYSFAPSQAIANPLALVHAVKTAMAEDKAMSEGTDTAGGFVAGGRHKAELDQAARDDLTAAGFAYIDSEGGRHLPINDAAHVRAALARFGQTTFESAVAKEKAWGRVLAAAKRYGVQVEDESMPKANEQPDEQKTMDQMAALRKVVKAHQDAAGQHADAMEQHKAAMELTKTYQLAIKNGDFDGDGDHDAIPDEKTVLRWVTRLEAKAGATMSATHKGQLHDAMGALQKLHGSQCQDPKCPYTLPADAEDDGPADGSGTDEGIGDSKTVGSLDWYRTQFAAQNAAGGK